MIGIKGYQDLKRAFTLEARNGGWDANKSRALLEVRQALKKKQITPEDFSIRRLAESFLGQEWFLLSDPRIGGGGFVPISVMESSGTVSASQFVNISGQIFFSKIMEAFANPAFAFSQLVPTVPSDILGPEIVPGITPLGDANGIVGEGEAYPYAGVTQDYIQLPAGIKRGDIVQVTREAILNDRTGRLLMNCGEVGYYLGANKECRIIDVAIDENDTKGRYNWRGTSYATYQASTPWINLKSTNGLAAHANIDAAEQLFMNMTDPSSGLPIIAMPTHIFVTQNLDAACANLLAAANLEVAPSGYPTGSAATVHQVANRWRNKYQQVTSPWMAYRMATDTNWFLADPTRAWGYKENWGVTVTTAPPNSEAEFTRDVMAQYKASERGAAYVENPRFAVKSTA